MSCLDSRVNEYREDGPVRAILGSGHHEGGLAVPVHNQCETACIYPATRTDNWKVGGSTPPPATPIQQAIGL